MSSQNVSVELVIAPLPEGWQGSPDDLIRHIMENASFSATGTFLGGQIGGARPTEDVGIWINGREIEVWDSDAAMYVPITTDPVGTIKSYAGAAVPTNYLLCDGQLVEKSDYPDLYAVVGDNYKKVSDGADQFRVPDMRGRTPVGAGEGDYNPDGTGTINGKMKELTLHDFIGAEWISVKQNAVPNAPVGGYNRVSAPFEWLYSKPRYFGIRPPSLVLNWIVKAK